MRLEASRDTRLGKVSVFSFASAEEISELDFDPQFSRHTNFRSIFTRSESLMRRAVQEDSNVVLAIANEKNIIGFGVLAYADPDQRWSKLDPPVMMEVKVVEVARDWRGLQIANMIVHALVNHPKVEERIFYMVGYTWNWDLEGAKLPASEYRKMMIGLFEPLGFVEVKTNEPNICLDPDNLFMCRIGKFIPVNLRESFKWLAFGIVPDEKVG